MKVVLQKLCKNRNTGRNTCATVSTPSLLPLFAACRAVLPGGFQGQAAGAGGAQAVAEFLVQGGEAGPVIAGHEQEQEGEREEVIGVDGVGHHGQEVGADTQLDEGQPSAAAAIGGVGQAGVPLLDGVLGSALEGALDPEQGLDDGWPRGEFKLIQ